MKEAKGVLLFNLKRPSAGTSAGAVDCMGLFYLAAVLEEKGWAPGVYHGFTTDAPEVMEKFASERGLLAVGFSCDYNNETAVEELCRYAKERYPGASIIVGGPQAAALGADFIARSGCDCIVRGEAEGSLPELLEHIASGDRTAAVRGVMRAGPDGGVIDGGSRGPVEDIDGLPLPAYHLSLRKDRSYGSTIFTGRGCPFSCAFCCQGSDKRSVRLRSVESVIKEISHNLDSDPSLRYLTFMDDTFTLDPRRVEALCAAMSGLREKRDLAWYCEGHVRTIARHPEMLDKMVASGLLRLQIGVESGSPRVLEAYDKKATVEEIESVVREAVERGVPQIATNLIVGGPFEDDGAIDETADLAERLLRIAPGVIDITAGFLRPYPGTAISKDPGAFGLVISGEAEAMSFDDYPAVRSVGLTAEETIMNRSKIRERISFVMRDIMKRGGVPFEAVVSQYRAAMRYGVTSMWYLEAFRSNHLFDEYFRMISCGAAAGFSSVPKNEFASWRPQRTVEIWRFVDMREGYPSIGGYVLSPLEFELLLRCSGKIRFEDIAEELFSKFGGNFKCFDDFSDRLTGMLEEFDTRRWTVFCKL